MSGAFAGPDKRGWVSLFLFREYHHDDTKHTKIWLVKLDVVIFVPSWQKRE